MSVFIAVSGLGAIPEPTGAGVNENNVDDSGNNRWIPLGSVRGQQQAGKT
jgi:hypothetical protein